MADEQDKVIYRKTAEIILKEIGTYPFRLFNISDWNLFLRDRIRTASCQDAYAYQKSSQDPEGQSRWDNLGGLKAYLVKQKYQRDLYRAKSIEADGDIRH